MIANLKSEMQTVVKKIDEYFQKLLSTFKGKAPQRQHAALILAFLFYCKNSCFLARSVPRNLHGGIYQRRWKMGAKPLFNFFQLPFSPLFQKFITAVHPIALQQRLMASLVSWFFSSLIPLNQRINFCNFVTIKE